jgi:signal transduction histidine kinase/CheY-like chemotaxis protein
MDRGTFYRDWHIHVAVFAVFALLAGVTSNWLVNRVLHHAAAERDGLRRLVAETERRQQAEASLAQSRKLEALGRLTGGVAHDFNNLLTVVLGSIEMLSRLMAEPRAQRLLSAAEQAAARGARLTSQMLAFSRRTQSKIVPIDVNAAIESIDDLLRGTVSSALEICYDLQDRLWPALADPSQFDVVLLNLMVNARDAMPDGGRITIRTQNLAHMQSDVGPGPGDWVVVAVEDTGHGMTEAVRASAFEPFFTTKDVGKGTGLGLYIVYGFAVQSGGVATIESAPGHGTTVRIFLPRSAAPPAPAETAAVSTDDRPPTSALHLLLVEDEAAVRELTVEMLQSLGHTVCVAASGREALSVLRSPAQLDLMLTDFAMPEMNGAELISAAVHIRPDLPVLLFSGYVPLAEQAGITGALLRKPFTAAELDAALRAAVGRAARRKDG